VHLHALGHVVLKVRNLQRSEDFFSGMLGMPIISRTSDPAMTFFALETSETIMTSPLTDVGLSVDLVPAEGLRPAVRADKDFMARMSTLPERDKELLDRLTPP
jgi:catechol 2,3-dioxygenase-like lactoylglutathione lyase family enzyme